MQGTGRPTRPIDRFADHGLVALSAAADGRPKDVWTVADACAGTQIFGGTGSGKTSGSGETLARAFLNAGFGGLVLTAKKEERELWDRYLRTTDDPIRKRKRWADRRVVEPGGAFRLNFLEYLARDGGGIGLTQNLVSLFMTALSSGAARSGSTDPYWDDALRQLLTHAVDLVVLSGGADGAVTLSDIAAVIRTAPQSRAEMLSIEWRAKSDCWHLLEKAEKRFEDMPAAERAAMAERWSDLEDTRDYWLLDFAGLAERTRSIIVNSFTSKASGLMRSPLRRLFCDDVTVRPDETHEGAVILLDLPVKEYGEVGRLAQVLFKTIWQRATERRRLDGDAARPVFLWADEAQYFVTAEDMLFQQTARSQFAATVYLTQSLPNYYAALDGTGRTAVTESLLGNLSTKIFHANGDPTTNEWGERLFGRVKTPQVGTSLSGLQAGTSQHEAFEPVCPASTFISLARGGPPDFRVDAVVFRSGRPWTNGTTRTDCSFEQNREQEVGATENDRR